VVEFREESWDNLSICSSIDFALCKLLLELGTSFKAAAVFVTFDRFFLLATDFQIFEIPTEGRRLILDSIPAKLTVAVVSVESFATAS